MRQRAHSCEGVGGDGQLARVDGIEADALHIVDGGVQARRARGVDGAGLKFVRHLGEHRALARDGLDHLAAREKRRQLLQKLAPPVQRPDAHGPVELVAGEGEEVRAQLLYVDRQVRRALRAVHHQHRTHAVRQLRDRADGVFASEHVRDLLQRDDPCPCRDERFDLVEVQTAVRLTFHEFELRAGLTADHLPGKDVAVVLHRGDQDLIARLDMAEPVAVGHKVQPLGRVAGEDDLLALRRAEKAGDGGAGALERFGRLDAQRVEPAQGIGVVARIELPLRVQHALRALGGGGAVEIGNVTLREQREIGFVIRAHSRSSFVHRTCASAPRARAEKASSSAMRASRSTAARARMASAAARSMPRLAK